MQLKTKDRTALFLILTFGISFSLAGLYRLFFDMGTMSFTVFGVIYMYVPAVSVLIVKKFIHNEPIRDDLLISFKINKWFFAAWLLMPMIVFGSLGINLLFPNVTYNPEMTGFLERIKEALLPDQVMAIQDAIESLPVNMIWLTLIQGLIAGATVNALIAFGEELGWRGFLLNSFRGMSFIKASFLIGIIWGIWHAPLILMGHNYPQHPQTGVLMMVVLCVLMTPFYLYMTIKARSVIAASIMHGTLNATAGISIMAISGGNDLTSGITGLAGFLTFSIFLPGLFVFDHYISKDKILTNRIMNNL